MTSTNRTIFFIVSTLILLVSSWLMLEWNHTLTTPSAPYGMVSYELAGGLDDDNAKANAIIQEWLATPIIRYTAIFSLGFDYAYMLIYTGWLLLVLWLLRSKPAQYRSAIGNTAKPATWWYVLMGATACIIPADALEDYYLTEQLFTGVALDHTSFIAYVAACIKFALIAVALIGIVVLLLKRLLSRAP